MNDLLIQVKGFTYEIATEEDMFSKIEIILKDGSTALTFQNVKFNRERLFEFFAAWKSYDGTPTAEKLFLGDTAYVEFIIVDEFEGLLSFVENEKDSLKVDFPIFFMEFETFIYSMLEGEYAYELAE